MAHIASGSTASPYISFTRSFGVARAYGIVGPAGIATADMPGYVYEIEIMDNSIVNAVDPIIEVAKGLPKPWQSPGYQHDGGQSFLLGVIDPKQLLGALKEAVVFPPGSHGTPRTPNLSQELETLVRALRDAEILVCGNVPCSLVRNRYEVF